VRRQLLRGLLLQVQLLHLALLRKMLQLVQMLDLLHQMLPEMVPLLLLATASVHGVVPGVDRILLHAVYVAGS